MERKVTSLKRQVSVKTKEILEKYQENDSDSDIETSFYQDTANNSTFNSKIIDWKHQKKQRNISSPPSFKTHSKSVSLNDLESPFKRPSSHSIKKSSSTSNNLRNSSAHNRQSSQFNPLKEEDSSSGLDVDNEETNKENIADSRPKLSTSKRLSSAEFIENVLHKYEIKEQIGRGAFASVFKATNRSTKKNIAIKKIDLNTENDMLELMSEINLLKNLKHANIVKYHGFFQKDSTLNIFLEYCDGGSLREFYRKIKKFNKENNRVTPSLLTESEIRFFIKQVLDGLEYLHSQGVVHRDIKAANILLTSQRVVKLADFGVSTKLNLNTVSTKNSEVVGTPNWMAPEIISLEKVSTSSDIWSLGATIIELFTGHPPYYNLNSMAALHAIVSDNHPKIPEEISEKGHDFLMKCFQKNPKLRSSAKELQLHPWLEGIEIVTENINGNKTNNESRNPSANHHHHHHHHYNHNRQESVNISRRTSISSTDSSISSSNYFTRRQKSVSSIPERNRISSQASSSFARYVEKDYETDDWDKDFADLDNLSSLIIEDQSINQTKNFSPAELSKLKIRKSKHISR